MDEGLHREMRGVRHDVFTKVSSQWEAINKYMPHLSPTEVLEFKEKMVTEDQQYIGYTALECWYGRLEGDVIKKLRDALDHIGRTDLSAQVLHHYQKPLVIACYKGDLSEVKRLHDLGLTLNYCDPEKGTPLHIAVRRRDRTMARYILHDPEPCDPNMADGNEMTSLQLACEKEDRDMIMLMLEVNSVDVNKKSKEQGTALLLACNTGNADIVQMLLKSGADATVVHLGATLLHVAVIKEAVEVAKHLLDHNVDLNALNNEKRTALMIASEYSTDALVSLLLAKGADPHVIGVDGYTALHFAASCNTLGPFKLLLEAIGRHHTFSNEGSVLDIANSKGSKDILVYLLMNDYFSLCDPGSSPLHWACENGAGAEVFIMLRSYCVQLELRDKYERTPLHIASEKGNEEIVNNLLQLRADGRALDNNEETPLHKASSKGHHKVAKLLLESREESGDVLEYVNASCRSKATALHRACASDHLAVVKVLLAFGADPTIKDNLGRTAAEIATDRSIIEALGGKAEKSSALTMRTGIQKPCPGRDSVAAGFADGAIGAMTGNVMIAPMLVKTKTVKRGVFLGHSPLHEAAMMGELHVIRFRMDQHNKPKVNLKDLNGNRPLHLAVANGHSEICEILLQEGAKVNAKNAQDLTPLAIAAQKGYQTIALNLLDHRADPSLETKSLDRPLQMAAKGGHEGVVKVLLSRRGSHRLDHRTKNGETALHMAARGGHAGVCRALLSKKALLDKKADPDATFEGETALYLAIRGGHVETVKALLENGANKDFKGPFRNRPLHVAVIENQSAIVDLLLKRKVNADCKDLDGVTPLYMACERGLGNIVFSLLLGGADANAKISRSGETPLFAAARTAVPDIVERLLQCGAKTSIKNGVGKIPVQVATDSKIKEIFHEWSKRKKSHFFSHTSIGRAASEVNMKLAGHTLLLTSPSRSFGETPDLPKEARSSDEDVDDDKKDDDDPLGQTI